MCFGCNGAEEMQLFVLSKCTWIEHPSLDLDFLCTKPTGDTNFSSVKPVMCYLVPDSILILDQL